MCFSIIVSVVVVDVVAVVGKSYLNVEDDIIVAVYAVVTDEFVVKNLAFVKG